MNKESEKQKRNADPAFVGLARLKAEQKRQLNDFEQSVGRQQWKKIHHSHYDWWMFPIDSPSAFGRKWTVYAGDIAELKQDPAYLRDYLRGVGILMAAWGWDLGRQEFLPNPATDQKWQHWPVRLYKAAYSLWLFGYGQELASLRKYALILIARGESMMRGAIDFGEFFTLGRDPYSKTQLFIPT